MYLAWTALVGDGGVYPYYVCDRCAHYWANAAWPDHCEYCRADRSWMTPVASLDDAEDRSEQILGTRRPVVSERYRA